MSSPITDNILKKLNRPDLIRILTEELSGTELNSLLLEVFSQRIKKLDPSLLLNQYQKNRFVKPADLPVLEMKQQELDLLKIMAAHSFQPIELSPVSILGSCSVVAPAEQKKILSALRGTEVLADATNAIALHCCDLKRQNESTGEPLRFGMIARHLRTQQVAGKGFTPHFKAGCLVTSGRDGGNYSFEKTSMLEHVNVLRAIFENHFKADSLKLRLLCRGGYPDSDELARQIKSFILVSGPSLDIQVIPFPEKDNAYYKGIQYKADIMVKGRQFEIGDGGFVDWPQQFLQDKKERMLTTGFGFDFMYRLLHGQV